MIYVLQPRASGQRPSAIKGSAEMGKKNPKKTNPRNGPRFKKKLWCLFTKLGTTFFFFNQSVDFAVFFSFGCHGSFRVEQVITKVIHLEPLLTFVWMVWILFCFCLFVFFFTQRRQQKSNEDSQTTARLSRFVYLFNEFCSFSFDWRFVGLLKKKTTGSKRKMATPRINQRKKTDETMAKNWKMRRLFPYHQVLAPPHETVALVVCRRRSFFYYCYYFTSESVKCGRVWFLLWSHSSGASVGNHQRRHFFLFRQREKKENTHNLLLLL